MFDDVTIYHAAVPLPLILGGIQIGAGALNRFFSGRDADKFEDEVRKQRARANLVSALTRGRVNPQVAATAPKQSFLSKLTGAVSTGAGAANALVGLHNQSKLFDTQLEGQGLKNQAANLAIQSAQGALDRQTGADEFAAKGPLSVSNPNTTARPGTQELFMGKVINDSGGTTFSTSARDLPDFGGSVPRQAGFNLAALASKTQNQQAQEKARQRTFDEALKLRTADLAERTFESREDPAEAQRRATQKSLNDLGRAAIDDALRVADSARGNEARALRAGLATYWAGGGTPEGAEAITRQIASAVAGSDKAIKLDAESNRKATAYQLSASLFEEVIPLLDDPVVAKNFGGVGGRVIDLIQRVEGGNLDPKTTRALNLLFQGATQISRAESGANVTETEIADQRDRRLGGLETQVATLKQRLQDQIDVSLRGVELLYNQERQARGIDPTALPPLSPVPETGGPIGPPPPPDVSTPQGMLNWVRELLQAGGK